MHLTELWGVGYEVPRSMQIYTLRFWISLHDDVMSQRFSFAA